MLLLFSAAIIYVLALRGGYKSIEEALHSISQQSYDLNAEMNRLERQATSVDEQDLKKRYVLFNEAFIKMGPSLSEDLTKLWAPAFEVHGWVLSEIDVQLCEPIANGDGAVSKINALEVSLFAESKVSQSQSKSEFLPFYTAVQALEFLWVRSPTKEYTRLDIDRLDGRFSLSVTAFLPLADTDFSEGYTIE